MPAASKRWHALAPRVAALRWVAGLYFLVLGASLLILPRPPLGVSLDTVELQGALAATSGLALLWVAVTEPARRITVAIHLLVAVAQLGLAANYVRQEAYSAAATLALFAAGIVVTAFAPQADGEGRRRADAAGLVLGGAIAAQGLEMLLRPAAGAWVPAQLHLSAHTIGLALLLSGSAVVATQVIVATPSPLRWAAHLVGGGIVLGLSIAVATWIDHLYWLLGAASTLRGMAMLILPRWGERAERFDARSLRPRLALAFVTAAVVPVLICLPLALKAVEDGAIAHARTTQEGLAASAAAAVAEQTGVLSARITDSGLLSLSGEEQDRLLRAAAGSDRTVYLIDASDRLLATSVPAAARPVSAVGDARAEVALARGATAGSALRDAPFGERVIGYAPVAGVPWRVVVQRSRASVLSDVNQGRRTAFALMVVIALAGALGAVSLAHQLTTPLAAIVLPVEQIAAGTSRVRVPRSRISELARLGAAVETTAAVLARNAAEREALLLVERQARQHAEAAVQLRDHVFHTVSHDLKSPLASIHGMTQLLQRRLAQSATVDSAEIGKRVNLLAAASAKMTAMLNELVDSTRIQMGEPLALVRKSTDAAGLVQRCFAPYEEGATGQQLRLHCPDTDLVGEWDRRRLERVVDNLLSNAVKYTPSGGAIDVVVRRDPVDPGRWVQINVQDQGIGIPVDELPLVFEPFRRASNVADIPGTSIGLVGAKAIVEQHGGTITVSSAVGGGTTMTVRLPLSPQPDADRRVVARAGPPIASPPPTCACSSVSAGVSRSGDRRS